MKILRLGYEWDRDIYCIKDDFLGIEWMNAVEVIHLLASKGMKAECRSIERSCLVTEEKKELFDRLWDDVDDPLDEDFEAMWVLADTLESILGPV